MALISNYFNATYSGVITDEWLTFNVDSITPSLNYEHE